MFVLLYIRYLWGLGKLMLKQFNFKHDIINDINYLIC